MAGLDLDVLRPATFARLAQVLLRYGVSAAGPVRAGQLGYLLFEDSGSEANQCLVDGPALGWLLAGTGVPGVVAMRYNVYVVTAAQFMGPITDEGVAVGGAFASDTATGLIPVAHRVAGVRSFQ